MDKPFRGTIKQAVCLCNKIAGELYGDPELEDGTVVMTSGIEYIIDAGDHFIVETKNSVFRVEFDPEYKKWYKENHRQEDFVNFVGSVINR